MYYTLIDLMTCTLIVSVYSDFFGGKSYKVLLIMRLIKVQRCFSSGAIGNALRFFHVYSLQHR
jgi:hypothetical protein